MKLNWLNSKPLVKLNKYKYTTLITIQTLWIILMTRHQIPPENSPKPFHSSSLSSIDPPPLPPWPPPWEELAPSSSPPVASSPPPLPQIIVSSALLPNASTPCQLHLIWLLPSRFLWASPELYLSLWLWWRGRRPRSRRPPSWFRRMLCCTSTRLAPSATRLKVLPFGSLVFGFSIYYLSVFECRLLIKDFYPVLVAIYLLWMI